LIWALSLRDEGSAGQTDFVRDLALTDDAISPGVFGVPTMQIGNELFWGYDDFPFLASFLADEDPLDPREAKKWSRSVQPASVRRRFRSG
jgi:hypothetical protein